MSTRAFRFGLQVFAAESRAQWQDQARRAEDHGFDTILVPDHVVAGLVPPLVALDAMAAVTTRLRVGTFVLNNDLRHPVLVARDAAALDLLSEGRLEVGIGAGHAKPEYTALGMPFDRAADRVSRLEEAVEILRRLFDGKTVTFEGSHYEIHDQQLTPHRHPKLLVGGNGDRVLALGAKMADIVGFTGLGRTRPDGQQHDSEWSRDQIDRKVAGVRAAAGERYDHLELNVLVQHIEITPDRRSVIEALAARVGGDVEQMTTAPYLLVGTIEQILEQLTEARDRWDFSYFVTRSIDNTAPILQALR
ncbi:MAG: TIGR03621 family F420-dependent LLM class oxidoreductase [Ilumatobacteraceae bacterium]